MSILTKIFGDPNEKVLREIQPIVTEINKLEPKFKDFDEEKLRAEMSKFKTELAGKEWNEQAEILEKILPSAFALIRETARRKLNQRHFDVQLLGGIVLHRGQIAEMRTGEGKTLTASLPVALNALCGRGVHVVTPNDYLSRVGGGWMAPVYHALGLSVSVIAHESSGVYDPEYETSEQHGNDERLRHWRPVKRKEAYACDIIYGTNNEYGFDYLRDNMAPDLEHMVQRDLHYSVVDEIDSILIDEARTPLIISAPAEESTDKYRRFAQLVTQLTENEDYNVDEKMRAASLTEDGLNKMEKLLGLKNIYTAGGVSDVHHIEQALRAHTLFKRDRDYVVKDGEIIIVDEFTGRMMPGRRYSEGLHQAIEAKENVQVQRESVTLATITFQNYFRMYQKLAGMTGTAVTEAEEFHKIYNLETVVIPTHRAMVRKDLTDLVYASEMGKFSAIVQEIKRRHELGQPVLVGTISIEKNEILAEMLDRAGVPAQILNAKQHEKEAGIIAQAGKFGAVTIATNMAGRGVDIILGGTPQDETEAKKICELGGLHVIGTERHESRRIDNQLRGRAGRQGDPGSSQFYLSMEDDLMRIFGGDRMKRIMSSLKVPEDMPIENRIIARSIEQAQKKVEANNFDIRKNLVEYDDVINKHRTAIYRRRREILNLTPNPSPYEGEGSYNISAESSSLQRENTRSEMRLNKIILNLIAEEIALLLNFHTAGEDTGAWNLKEIQETVKTIFLLPSDFAD
jgi:preprotein translocase subunit SecA